MRALRSFLIIIYDLLVGDDWTTAVGIAGGLALTAALVASGVAAWWLMPVVLPVLLTVSLYRVIRRSDRHPS